MQETLESVSQVQWVHGRGGCFDAKAWEESKHWLAALAKKFKVEAYERALTAPGHIQPGGHQSGGLKTSPGCHKGAWHR